MVLLCNLPLGCGELELEGAKLAGGDLHLKRK